MQTDIRQLLPTNVYQGLVNTPTPPSALNYYLTLADLPAGGSGWLLDGNTVGPVENWIGTIDNFDFPIRTNSVEKGRITTTGQWLVGGLNTGATLSVTNFSGGFDIQRWYSSGGLEKMRVTDAGNVGIGTSAPNNLFQVAGYINFGVDTENNLRIGYLAGASLAPNVGAVTGVRNLYIGSGAGNANISGIQNVAIGWEALNDNTGDQNTAIGVHSSRANVTGVQFVSIGNNAHENGASGDGYVAIGVQALLDSIASDNIAIGRQAMLANTTGGGNVGIGGAGVMAANLVGTENVAIGSGASRFNLSSENVSIGASAFYNNASGNNNTVVGRYAGYTGTTYTGSVFLGNRAGFYETGDNKLFIDNQLRTDEATSRISSLIYGVFDAVLANQSLTVNGLLKTSIGFENLGTLKESKWALIGSGAYAVLTTDYLIHVNVTASVPVLPLMSTAGVGKKYIFFVNPGVTATITANAADTIFGAVTFVLVGGALGASVVLRASSVANYWVVGD